MPIATNMTTVPAVQPAAAQPAAAQSETSGLGSLSSSDFLRLLVAQITNQDPLDPVSSSQFMSQTAELSTLEQITALSQETAQASAAQQTGAAIQTIGKIVTGTTQQGQTVTGTVTGVEPTAQGPLLQVGDNLVAFATLTAVT